ncbi:MULTISPECIES: STAS domain-containing protein [unclassified Mycobacterium]|jgi:anti-anti-sigma factor|uniref:STAS domain-containing protein n=1 Tax=unclassified Mycobacterium TaxID=2642494 RepID=UPI00342C08D2
MATPLSLDTQRIDGTVVLTAAGEIDLSNVEEFSQGLTGAAQTAGAGAVTVDLSAVRYVDSAAINALFTIADVSDRLRLIVHPLLMRVLDISGLTQLATVEAARVDGAG